MRLSRTVVVAILLVSSAARAAPGAPDNAPSHDPDREPTWQDDAEAHCRVVTGVAESESAILLSPRVFGVAGVARGVGASADPSGLLPPLPRVTFGLSYSAADLHRALLLRGRARAQCTRRRLASQLEAFVQANEGLLSKKALSAQLAVLEAALPRAQEIVARTQAAVGASRATLEELGATELRLDRLRAEAESARRGIELASAAPAPARPIADLLDALEAAEVEVERYDASVRQSYAWDVELQGGYDQVFGARSRIPIFGTIQASARLGLLFSRRADARAIAARRAFARQELGGVRHRAMGLLRALSATERAERARMIDTAVLLTDLESRLASVESVGGDKARGYAEYLWFEVVRARAEHAYLRAHVAELASLLGAAPERPRARR